MWINRLICMLSLLLCIAVIVSGCGKYDEDLYDVDDVYDPNIKNNYDSDKSRSPVKITFSNEELLNEHDVIEVCTRKDLNKLVVYTLLGCDDGYRETTFRLGMYELFSCSFDEMKGKVEVREGEETHIHIDYLTKTITAENVPLEE